MGPRRYGTDSKLFSKSLHYALTAAPLLDNGGLASSWLVVGEGVSHNDEWGIWGAFDLTIKASSLHSRTRPMAGEEGTLNHVAFKP